MANRTFAKGRQRVAGAACIGGRGRFSPEDVAERLEEAADTLRRMPREAPRGYKSCMPTPLRESKDVWQNAVESGRFEDMAAHPGAPSSLAIDRMDEAMRWLSWLTAGDAKLLWARACGVPWKVLVFRMKASRMTLWRRWVGSLQDISLKLNENRCYKKV
jgi:hypothetical protein